MEYHLLCPDPRNVSELLSVKKDNQSINTIKGKHIQSLRAIKHFHHGPQISREEFQHRGFRRTHVQSYLGEQDLLRHIAKTVSVQKKKKKKRRTMLSISYRIDPSFSRHQLIFSRHGVQGLTFLQKRTRQVRKSAPRKHDRPAL